MPKIVTDAEREQMREMIYRETLSLIREKGVRKVTVDDIAAAVGISKGAFYGYYQSKEIGLYEVLKRSEAELFGRMEAGMAGGIRDQKKGEQFLRDIFLAPDSIILHLSPKDQELLLCKLPPEYRERENSKSANYFERSMELLGVGQETMEALALLTDCMGTIAADRTFSPNGRQQALDTLITATAAYLAEKGKR